MRWCSQQRDRGQCGRYDQRKGVSVRTVDVSELMCAPEQVTTSQPLQSKPEAEASIFSSTCGSSLLTN